MLAVQCCKLTYVRAGCCVWNYATVIVHDFLYINSVFVHANCTFKMAACYDRDVASLNLMYAALPKC